MDEFYDGFGVVCKDDASNNMFITYKSSNHVTTILQEHKPLLLVIIRSENESFTIISCLSNKRNSDGEFITKGLEVMFDLEQENVTQMGQQFFELELKIDEEIKFSDACVMCYGIALPYKNKYTIITSEWQQVVKVESMNDNDENISRKLELCHYKI